MDKRSTSTRLQRSAGFARAFFCALSLFVLSAFSPSPFAQERQSQAFAQIGLALQNFHYKETDEQNTVLDREDGLLPGVEISFGNHIDRNTILLTGSQHDGTIAYDGHTGTGRPHVTDTEERIVDVALLIKRSMEPSADSPRVTGGLGYREWRRDILATEFVSGLFEIYRWPYLMLGVEADAFQNGPWKVGLDWRLTRPVHPTIEVALPGYDPLTLELGANVDVNICFPIEYRFTARQAIVVVPYWQRWTLERSRYKRLYSNGIPTPDSAQEPDSEMTIFGISATLRFSP